MSHAFDSTIRALVYGDGRVATRRLTVAAAASAQTVVLCGSDYALSRFPRSTIQSIIALDTYAFAPDAALVAAMCLATKGAAGQAIRLPGLLDRYFLAPDAIGNLSLVKISSQSADANGDFTIMRVVHRSASPYPDRDQAAALFYRDVNPNLPRPLIPLEMAQTASNLLMRETEWRRGDETAFVRAVRAALRRIATTDPTFLVLHQLAITATVDLTQPQPSIVLDVNFRDLLRASGKSLADTFSCSALIERWNSHMRAHHPNIFAAGTPSSTALVPIDRASKLFPPVDREYADGWERRSVPTPILIDLATTAHQELNDEAFLASLEAA